MLILTKILTFAYARFYAFDDCYASNMHGARCMCDVCVCAHCSDVLLLLLLIWESDRDRLGSFPLYTVHSGSICRWHALFILCICIYLFRAVMLVCGSRTTRPVYNIYILLTVRLFVVRPTACLRKCDLIASREHVCWSVKPVLVHYKQIERNEKRKKHPQPVTECVWVWFVGFWAFVQDRV